MALDLHRACRPHPAAAVRPEPSGALVHHSGSGRLSVPLGRPIAGVAT